MTRETYAVIDKRSSLHFPKERWPKLWDAQSENFEDPDHRIYTNEWCDAQQRDALRNFDLNMQHFASLDSGEFDRMVEEKIASRKRMVEVVDLNVWDSKTGLYVMVHLPLDETARSSSRRRCVSCSEHLSLAVRPSHPIDRPVG